MRNKNVSVGIFVLGGLLLFGIGLFLIGDRRQTFGQHVEYYSEFGNLAGLSNGAKVRVGGMDAGEVIGIIAPDSPPSRFRVRWRISARLRGLVRTDSVVTVDTEGVVGGTYLSVRPGSATGLQASALSTIPSREPTEISELLVRGNSVLNDAQAMLKDLDGKIGATLESVTSTVSNVNDIAVGLKQGRGAAGMLLRDDEFANQLRRNVTTTASNLDDIVAGVKAGHGAVGMLLRDQTLEGEIRGAIKNAQQATVDLNHASNQVDALVSDLNSHQIPKKADDVIASLNESARQVNQMISEINQPDRQGMSAGANIRESLANANVAALNLADDAEALKHNFLLRGFFRRRGFYNLDRISPEQYRRDPAFTSGANYRVWLSGSELFQAGPNGQEELSAPGRELLNSALTEYGDSIVESPIVVEGYCSGRAADQLRLSRGRAILVRQYLQTRFQLDSSNLGIVAMKSSPPYRTGRATWDGICIVLLRRKI
jgi:phospholipid/cholesterol/gamma-HCH transport system substrate-binding protein